MQQTRSVELGTGLFVLLGFAALFFLTTQTTGSGDFQSDDAYEVSARFENVGSLKDRAPVAMSGVTIGRVTSVEFDPRSLDAVVTFIIDGQFDEIPEDSDASILTAGLLGSQYISLQAGGSGVDTGAFWQQMQSTLDIGDIQEGIVKSVVFGVVASAIAVWEGYNAHPTAEGVGRATTRTVVITAISVLILDFMITAIAL